METINVTFIYRELEELRALPVSLVPLVGDRVVWADSQRVRSIPGGTYVVTVRRFNVNVFASYGNDLTIHMEAVYD